MGWGLAVTGLSSAGPGSQAAAAAQDPREGDLPYLAPYSPSSTLSWTPVVPREAPAWVHAFWFVLCCAVLSCSVVSDSL